MTGLADLLSPHTRMILIMGCGLMAVAGWWCQIWRYPEFRSYSEQEWLRKHMLHALQVSLVVVPGMILQILGTGLFWAGSGATWLKTAHAICLIGSLGLTFFVSAPIHGKLSMGKDDRLIQQLLRTNLPRTLFWTIQFALVFA